MPSVVQKASASNSATGVTTQAVSLPGTIPGNTIVVFAGIKDFSHAFTLSISDGVNSYTSRGSEILSSDAGLFQMWEVDVGVGGDLTITVTASSAVDAFSVVGYELTPSTFDQIVSAAGGGTSLSVGSITPGTASGIGLCGIYEGNAGVAISFTAGALFTKDTETNSTGTARWAGAGESKIYSSTAPLTAAWTWDNNASFGAGIFATFTDATHSISGSAGAAGATVAYAGPSSGSVTADGSGNYTITNLGAGTYTVTPSLAGYSFSPTSHSETISGSDITGVNFTATHLQVATATFSPVAGTYSEAQTVTVSNASSALSGFAMYYTTDGSSPTTGSTLYTGPITVSDSLTLKVLSVATGYLNSAIASAAYIIGFAISGNAGVAGATVNVTGTSAGSATADGSGNYSVSGLVDGSYTVTPVLARYKFTPASRNKTISGGDVTGVNFTAKLSYSNHRSK